MRTTFDRLDVKRLFKWTAYTGASVILEKLFSKSSFDEIVCLTILASGPHLDPTIASDNIFRSSSIHAVIFNCGPLIRMQ